MKIDPYCQQSNCSTLNVLFSGVNCIHCTDCVDIASRSSATGHQTTLRWQNKSSYTCTHGCRALTWR